MRDLLLRWGEPIMDEKARLGHAKAAYEAEKKYIRSVKIGYKEEQFTAYVCFDKRRPDRLMLIDPRNYGDFCWFDEDSNEAIRDALLDGFTLIE